MVIRSAALVAFLGVACVSDLRSRRIPNWLVLLTATTGIVVAVSTLPFTVAMKFAGGGLLTGLAIWFPFYLFRMLGAGDVKLFAAAATFLGSMGAAEGALYTALYGGLVAVGYTTARSGWASTLIRLVNGVQNPSLLRNGDSSRWRMPYAFAIAGGVLTAFWWPGHLL
jgi:prepilin peptidase CpaA